jgi:parallel beta helix pectate lyase-like protein
MLRRSRTSPTSMIVGLMIIASCGDSPTEPAPVPTRVEFSAQPTNAIAGEAISPHVRIRVLDASGNAFTGPMTVSLTLTSSNGAVLLGTTSVAAANGVATFSDLRIEKAGTGYVLNAAAGSLTGAGSSPFDVTHGAATKLRFVGQPSPATAGKPISPAVTVEITDQYDNRATSATHVVTVHPSASVQGLYVLGAARVVAVLGLATFDNIAMTRSGSHSLRAVAIGLADATSELFAVVLASQSRFCPTDPAGNGTFGSILDAMAATEPKGTIAICDGTHTFQVIIDRPLTIVPEHEGMVTVTNPYRGFPILITTVPSGTVRISGLNFEASYPGGVGVFDSYDTVVVENSRFKAAEPTASAVIVRATTGPATEPVVTARGNTATGFDEAFVVYSGSAHVLDNRIDASGTRAIHFYAGTRSSIQRNRITNCGGRDSCIQASGGATGYIELLDNVIENDIAQGTYSGLSLSGRVVARRNRIVGIGGTGLQQPLGAQSFPFRIAAISVSAAVGVAPVVEENEIINATAGISTVVTTARPTIRDNRIRLVWTAFSAGTAGTADFERNDVSEYAAMFNTAPAAGATFKCNWWGRAIGPTGVGASYGNVPPFELWQPFSTAPIAGKSDVTCDRSGTPAPTRFCPPGFFAGTGWSDFADAVAVTAPGGTIRVCDGTHEAFATIDRSLTIAAEHAHAATLSASTVFIVGGATGTVTIRDLNFVSDDGIAIMLTNPGTTDPARSRYDQVVIDNNRFTITAPRGNGIYVGRPDIETAKVVVRRNVFTGGYSGVTTVDPPALEIVDNTFKDQVRDPVGEVNSSIHLSQGGPYVVQRNLLTGCPNRCMNVESATADVSDNTLETSVSRGTKIGISIASAKVTVNRNVIRGVDTAAARADGDSYAFKWAGIMAQPDGSTVTLEGNSITNANAGIDSWDGVTGSNNTVRFVHTPVATSNGGPTLSRNDFLDYTYSFIIVRGTPQPGVLKCNYWGAPTGPPPEKTVHDAAYYTPFSAVPIAGKPDVVCP